MAGGWSAHLQLLQYTWPCVPGVPEASAEAAAAINTPSPTTTAVGGPQIAAPSLCRRGVQLAMAGKNVTALVDTGAACTLMALNLFEELCRKTNRSPLLQPTGKVTTLGGHPVDILGQTEVMVDHAGPISVLVSREEHPLLLGSDSILRGKGVINYADNTFHWYDHEYPLLMYSDSGVHVGDIRDSTGHASIDAVLSEYSDVFGLHGDL